MWRFYNDCLKSYDHQVILLMNGMCLLGLPVHICTYMCLFPPLPCFIMALVISMGSVTVSKQSSQHEEAVQLWKHSSILRAR